MIRICFHSDTDLWVRLRRYLSHAEAACKVSVGIYLSHKNTHSHRKGKGQIWKNVFFEDSDKRMSGFDKYCTDEGLFYTLN